MGFLAAARLAEEVGEGEAAERAEGGGSGGGEDEEDPPPPPAPPPTGDGDEVRSGMGERYMAGKEDGSRPKIAPYTTASRATRLQYRMPNCCEFRIVMAAVGREGSLAFPHFLA